jgi:nucleotide-binding universal stress UspA family protein
MTEQLSPVGRFQTIVLATDGSEYSAAAEAAALEMARRCSARLLVTRVVLTNPEYEALVPDRVQEAEDRGAEAHRHAGRKARSEGVRPKPSCARDRSLP